MQFQDNQILPQTTCMAWGCVTKRRVLSDKQIKKEKKLSLSIIADTPNKSIRKLTLTNSFLPHTGSSGKQNGVDTRPNSNGKQSVAVSINRDVRSQKVKVNQIKGLNCNSNYISFSPEKQAIQQTIKTTHNLSQIPNHGLACKKRPKFFDEGVKQKNNSINEHKQNILLLQDVKEEKGQKMQTNTTRRSNRQQPMGVSQFYIQETSDSNRSSQISINIQRKSEEYGKNMYKMSACKKITNLEEAAATVVSKFDSSSRKSESLSHSNVIFRLVGGFSQEKNHPSFTLKKIQSEQHSPIKKLNMTDRPSNPSFKKIKQATQQSIIIKNQHHKNQKIFEKLNYLGVGRFANVYMVRQCKTGLILAIKQILKFTIQCNSLHNQILRQIQIQSQIRHPNIVALYYAYADAKRYNILMEYGQTNLLAILRQHGRIPEQKSKNYLRQIISGIQAIHAAGAVHRDIKPQNIILVNGICKIGDFGWANWMNNKGIGQLCGTPGYASPQIMNMQTYTQKTDCWSLGVLAYQLVSGPLPQTFFQQKTLPINKNMINQLGVSRQYKTFIEKLLTRNEEDRPSINEVAADPLFTNN